MDRLASIWPAASSSVAIPSTIPTYPAVPVISTDSCRIRPTTEADLPAAKEKAKVQANKKSTQLREQRAKLVEKRDALNSKIAEIDEQLPEDVEPDPIIAATGEDQATAGAEVTES